jgi:hypothetical protein
MFSTAAVVVVVVLNRVALTCGDVVGFSNGGYCLSSCILGWQCAWQCAIGRGRRYRGGFGEIGHGVVRRAVVCFGGEKSRSGSDSTTAQSVQVVEQTNPE